MRSRKSMLKGFIPFSLRYLRYLCRICYKSGGSPEESSGSFVKLGGSLEKLGELKSRSCSIGEGSVSGALESGKGKPMGENFLGRDLRPPKHLSCPLKSKSRPLASRSPKSS